MNGLLLPFQVRVPAVSGPMTTCKYRVVKRVSLRVAGTADLHYSYSTLGCHQVAVDTLDFVSYLCQLIDRNMGKDVRKSS